MSIEKDSRGLAEAFDTLEEVSNNSTAANLNDQYDLRTTCIDNIILGV
jgi:hypothetical protein